MTTTLCRIVTDTDILRDLTWATSDCLVSWSNVGIWTSDNIHTVTTSARSNEGSLLAVGDDGGYVSCQHLISRSLLGDEDSSVPKEELQVLTN